MTPRCYLPPDDWREGEIRLAGAQAHHLLRVLRVRRGDALVCLDGAGRESHASVRQLSTKEITLHLGPTQYLPEEPFSITLAMGVPGQGKLAEIVNQATQLGVAAIAPLSTERQLAGKRNDRADQTASRLHRVAVEAIKQSGTTRIPRIQPIRSFKEILTTFSGFDRVLLASLTDPREDLRVLLTEGQPRRVLILIGPEGDFSPQEISQAVEAGARCFSLGPSVLRCETACVGAVSVVSFLLRQVAAKIPPCHP